jgi:group I intron endonuclease
MYIYKTTNLINNKVYIGKSEKEFDGTYYGSGIILQKAIKKYGKSNFIVDIIENCNNITELNTREKYWIKYYSSNSYNLAEGGTGGNTIKHFSDKRLREYKLKLSKVHMGHVVTDETRKKLRKANKGRLMGDREAQAKTIQDMWKDPNSVYNSDEYRNNLSRAGKLREWSDETKEKIRQSKLGSKNPSSVSIKVGELIFETRKDCAKHFNISDTAVTKRCKSKNFTDWIIVKKQ